MGTIIKKINKGLPYFYYAECRRVDGKPRIFNQKYLGTAKSILEKVHPSKQPSQETALYSEESEFGAVTLLHDIARRIGVVDLIDGVVPKRNQGQSVGTYCLAEAVNRAPGPVSTSGLQEWHQSTVLPAITGIPSKAFSPQNFWNNTGIGKDDIEKIDTLLTSTILDKYNIDISRVIYDATNFFTYIDTRQDGELARRGHCKSKRKDLRIVGLALMVSPDFSIPLLHDAYPGNRADSDEFAVVLGRLKKRLGMMTEKEDAEITVVFDRGNNSESNLDLLESDGLGAHYVGGLKKNHVPGLFAMPKSDYSPLSSPDLTNVTAFKTEATVFSRDVVVVMTHNPDLEEGQMRAVKNNIKKTTDKLMEIQVNLLKRSSGLTTKGRKPTIDSVMKKEKNILNTEYMSDIFTFKVIEDNNNIYLTYGSDGTALDRLKERELGKTALFTDRRDLTAEEIIGMYRSAWRVESAFRQMKDTRHLTVRPIFHWTDEKIAVHLFTCVLAYRLCCLLVKELSDKGISTTIGQMFGSMSKIKRITSFFGDIGKPQKIVTFLKGGELAEKIETLYQLKKQYS
jgi:transposase